MNNLILISIKGQYVNEMLCGRKKIELRKSVPKASAGDVLIIYTTHPKKAITAIAIVEQIITCTPKDMWNLHSDVLGINKVEFDNYYKNHKKAVGIELTNIIQLNAEILLSAIKLVDPKFSPPQTFKYLNKFTTLRDFRHLIGQR
ncbi:MAG: ASCH domain-containing protein [Mucilaginibacter sp.]